mmetsp:Transcript_47520/g.115725  ORF Transcript_47520/g.115725 Transcript_47520/m.115725 type:complete len:212 (+) Transcript_47520:1652-2287(+)
MSCLVARQALEQLRHARAVAPAEAVEVHKSSLYKVAALANVVPPHIELCQCRVLRHTVGKDTDASPSNVVCPQIQDHHCAIDLEHLSKACRSLRRYAVVPQLEHLDGAVAFHAKRKHTRLGSGQIVVGEVQRDEALCVGEHLRDDKVAPNRDLRVAAHLEAVHVLPNRHLQRTHPHPVALRGTVLAQNVPLIFQVKQLVTHPPHAHVIHGV